MRAVAILTLFLLCRIAAGGKNLDSLQTLLRTAESDTVRSALLMELAFELEATSADSAISLYDAAYHAAGLQSNHRQMALARQSRGIVLTESGRYAEAVIAYKEAIALFRRSKNSKGEANSWNNLGNTYLYLASYHDAADAYYRAIPMFEAAGNSAALIVSHGNLGECYRQLGDYSAMLTEMRKMYRYAKESGDEYEIANASISLGAALANNSQPDSAAILLRNAHRAGVRLQDAALIFYALYDLADGDLKSGRIREALQRSDSARTAAEEWGREYAKISARLLQGRSLQANRKTKDARIIFEEALSLARSGKSREQELEALNRLAELSEQEGDYRSSLALRKEWIALNDSVYNDRSIRQISELRTIYETAEKERLLREEQQLSTEKDGIIARRSTLLLISCALILVVLLAGWLIIRQLRTRRMIAEHAAAIEKERAAGLEKEQEILRYRNESLRKNRETELLRAMVDGQEEERRRLGRELHDGLGGLVTAARMQLEEISRSGSGPLPVSDFLNLKNLLTKASKDLRDISHNLAPEGIGQHGLAESVSLLCRSLSLPNLPVDFSVHGTARSLGKTSDMHLFRIIQELLHNILKHSEASHAFVELNFGDNALSVTVEDNGKGMKREDVGEGSGLTAVRNRASYLQAAVDVTAQPGRGTSFHIQIPYSHG
jgi:signal transduction histidine kinase